MNILRYITTSEKARVPTRGSEHAAGYDLYTIDGPPIGVLLQHAERRLFHTGLIIEIPTGYYGRIAPRSGLALKHGIDVLAGIIDEDYRNEVGIILINLNGMPVVVDTDKPIAQLIIEPYLTVAWEKAESLSDTKRGLGGFGSSDVKVSPIALNESTPQMAEAYREANYIR